MKFICSLCQAECLNPRELLDHWREKHPETLRRYHIVHMGFGQQAIEIAPTPREACRQAGWRASDCRVKEIKDANND